MADFLAIFAFHGNRIGLALALLVGAVLGAVVVLIKLPLSPPEPVQGRLLSLGLRETEVGSFPQATVSVEGVNARVDLTRASGCMIGDAIELTRERRIWGVAYRVRPGYRCAPLP